MYSVRNITENLYWVGANDHRLTLFENIHPIPQGVSYNTYLLKDDNSVLFDTIDWSSCRQFIENLEFLLEGKPLDYMVINHVEPDHGASIEEVIIRWPDIKIISTHKAFMLMAQFGVTVNPENAIEVKEGDTYCFGKHTVTFLEAPMVHWPEVMGTLDLTNGALFAADAFGSFGALDGKLFNDEVDFDRDWLDEARRYYTNIVGKYGPHVQRLMGKASEVVDRIKFICPLHGPVWRSDFEYLLDKYQHWSTYEPEVKGVMIAYASMYGNTESAAQALAARLCEKGITNVAVYDVSNTHVSYLISEAFKYSHIVLASVTYNLGIYPVMHNFLSDMAALNLQRRKYAIIENGSWACKSGDLMQKFIEEKLKKSEVISPRLSMASSLRPDKEKELEALADAIIESLNA